MIPTVNVSGTNMETGEDDTSVSVEDFSMATVDFGESGQYAYACRACGTAVDEDGNDGRDENECDENEPEDDDEDGPNGPHDPAPAALNWVNHAGVSVNEEEDSVTVHISVGDPRGAFTFTVRRIPADADNELAGRLIMHLPYPGEPLPHAKLTDSHTGTYIIGD